MMYEFTKDMDEISGFGGGYEAMCRAMVKAGCEWFDARATQDETTPVFEEYENIIGIITEKNPEAKALTDAMAAAARPLGGATGASMQACVHHVLSIRRMGWPAYVEKMTGRAVTKSGG